MRLRKRASAKMTQSLILSNHHVQEVTHARTRAGVVVVAGRLPPRIAQPDPGPAAGRSGRRGAAAAILRRPFRRRPGTPHHESQAGQGDRSAVFQRVQRAALGDHAHAAVVGRALAGAEYLSGARIVARELLPPGTAPAVGPARGTGGLCPQRLRPRPHGAERRHAGPRQPARQLQPRQHRPAGRREQPQPVGRHRGRRAQDGEAGGRPVRGDGSGLPRRGPEEDRQRARADPFV